MDPRKLTLVLSTLAFSAAWAAEGPSSSPVPPARGAAIPDTTLSVSSDVSAIEEGKALYENGQMIAALGKFMTVLRTDPHNEEARQYLRMIVDIMRQNPSISSKKMGSEQAVASNPALQEEIRRMLQLRARLTMDLKAIPGVQIVNNGTVSQVWIESPLFFNENSGGLKEQGVPILDRVAAWLKSFGQQPVIIHCYPEELQESSSNGSLFLRRYSELYNFFVDEKKLAPQRFIGADLLKGDQEQKTAVDVSTTTSRIVIETIGSQSSMMEAMPSMTAGRAMSQWLENSILPDRKVFNPEEGEWVSLDLAAISRSGLRKWTFTIMSSEAKSPKPAFKMEGTGNLLKRQSWDGHDQTTGDFVPAGSYVAHLTAVNSDGTIKTQEEILQVERTTKEAPVVVAETPKPKAKHHKKKPKATSTSATSSPAVTGGGTTSTAIHGSPTATLGDDGNKAAAPATPAVSSDDTGDSVHAIWKQVINFDPNQSELAPTVKSSLERIGKTLEVYPLQKVRITGFAMTSETGADQLALKRAEAVRAILVDEYHVDAKRVIVAGGKTTADANASKVEMSITN